MALRIVSPFGLATGNFVMLAGVRWDRQFSINVDLIGNGLTASSESGFGQGACVAPEIAQSSGKVYWEVTWTGLSNPSLAGGVGLCTIEAIANYDGLAASGTGGIIARPNGTAYEAVPNGNGVGPSNPPWPLLYHTLDGANPLPIQEGDTLGFYVDFDSARDFGFLEVNILVVTGAHKSVAGTFFPPWGTYIPCVVFDTASQFDILAVTANFGADVHSFLGPTVFPNFGWDGITLGWPNTP